MLSVWTKMPIWMRIYLAFGWGILLGVNIGVCIADGKAVANLKMQIVNTIIVMAITTLIGIAGITNGIQNYRKLQRDQQSPDRKFS